MKLFITDKTKPAFDGQSIKDECRYASNCNGGWLAPAALKVMIPTDKRA